jgi:hypothetical protein
VTPFVDRDKDGKIDSEEYQAFQDYKQQHTDWQNLARKELGMDMAQGN